MPKHGSVITTPDGKQRIWKNRYIDGKLVSQGCFLNNIRDGIIRRFYRENEKVFCEGYYSNGKKTGCWIFYSLDGSITEEIIFI